MAAIIDFIFPKLKEASNEAEPRTYNVEIAAYPDDYLEFTAKGVRPDAKSLCRIADELEKIASIIRSDVITQVV